MNNKMDAFSRVKLLIGQDNFSTLKNASVAVFGVGGVGGYAVEALARSGIGSITVFDDDTVDITNINRQIIALHSTVGRLKTEVAAERAKREEETLIPHWLDYDKCPAVRFESREKLKKFKPENLSQAGRISGVTPADIAVLSVIIKRGHH